MLWAVAIVLLILWALGFIAFQFGGWPIHLLVVAAVALVIIRLATGRRVSAVRRRRERRAQVQ